jgi:Cys-tRNA(Pro)/Cys-tRNA(Cys) deacylase
LDRENVAYAVYEYLAKDGKIDGVSVAQKMNLDPKTVYKTIVVKGVGREYYVCVVPVEREIDLKSAARAVGEKSVSLIPVVDLNRVTGYIRGGCSPIGMKKQFGTVLDQSCANLEQMVVSAGKIGHQIGIHPQQLARLTKATFAAISTKE